MPLILNFTLNAINSYYFVKRKTNPELIINILLGIACIWIFFYLENLIPKVFNLGYLFLYAIGVEMYCFTLSLEMNDP